MGFQPVQAAFSAFDLNKDGLIDRSEFEAVMQSGHHDIIYQPSTPPSAFADRALEVIPQAERTLWCSRAACRAMYSGLDGRYMENHSCDLQTASRIATQQKDA